MLRMSLRATSPPCPSARPVSSPHYLLPAALQQPAALSQHPGRASHLAQSPAFTVCLSHHPVCAPGAPRSGHTQTAGLAAKLSPLCLLLPSPCDFPLLPYRNLLQDCFLCGSPNTCRTFPAQGRLHSPSHSHLPHLTLWQPTHYSRSSHMPLFQEAWPD